MQFSIKNLLAEVIEDEQTDYEFLPLARRLQAGINARIQREIDDQIDHRYQGHALLLKLFSAASDAPRLSDVQEARRDLASGKDGLNARIENLAAKLADLLRERERKEHQARLRAVEPHTLDSRDPVYVCDTVMSLIDRAVAETEPVRKQLMYSNNLRRHLTRLDYRFDDKYWPDQADLVDAIAAFAGERQYLPSDALGLIPATIRQRDSAADFVRLLEDGLSEIRGLGVGSFDGLEINFPEDFILTDECKADLIQIFGFGAKSAKEVRQYRRADN